MGGIHVFIGKIGEPAPEPDICTDIIETAQRASPSPIQLKARHVFIGVIHGSGHEDGPVSEGETVVCSDDESSGETESLYQLQDGRIEGGSEGNSIPDSPGPPNRAAVFMAGTRSVPHSSTAVAVLSGSTTATPAGAGSSVPPLAQVLSDLFDALAALMSVEVDATARDQHDAEIAKVKDQIAQAKADLAGENTRMATKRAELEAQAYRMSWIRMLQKKS